MRAALLAGLLSLCASLPARAADPAELYRNGHFDQAAAAYRALADREPGEAAHHYNLGNALYKSGRLGPATASYLRAFRLAPRDTDVRYNLAFALQRAGESLVAPGVPEGLHRLLFLFSGAELRGAFTLCWTAFFMLWGLHLLDSRFRRPVLLFCAGAAVALTGGWLALRRSVEPETVAVTLRPDAEVRSGPGRNFPAAYTLPEGRRVEVQGWRDGWVEVGVARDGIKGWMENGSLERL